MTTPKDTTFALSMRDGLFLKDGKGWSTSSLGRASTLSWPYPSTLRGALRTAVGHAIEAREGRTFSASDWLQRTSDVQLRLTLPLRRPLADTSWRAEHLLWPAPKDALITRADDAKLGAARLDPTPPHAQVGSLCEEDNARLETLWRPRPNTKHKPASGSPWWTHTQLIAWLAGESVTPPEAPIAPPQETRTHVTLDPKTHTAKESLLYATTRLATLERDASDTLHEWSIGIVANLPDAPPEHLSAGGKRHLGATTPLPDALLTMPDALASAFDRGPLGLRLMAATPLHFASGWLIDGLLWDDSRSAWTGSLNGQIDTPLVLRAAIVPRPEHVSGWDMAHRRPKPTLRLVPAGAMYFFTRADGKPFTRAQATKLWLMQLGQAREDGFGTVVPGVWHPQTSSTT